MEKHWKTHEPQINKTENMEKQNEKQHIWWTTVDGWEILHHQKDG